MEGAVRGLPRGQEARRRPHSRSRLQGSRSAAQRCSLARGAACRHVPSACQGCPRPRAVLLHPPPPRCLLEPAGQQRWATAVGARPGAGKQSTSQNSSEKGGRASASAPAAPPAASRLPPQEAWLAGCLWASLPSLAGTLFWPVTQQLRLSAARLAAGGQGGTTGRVQWGFSCVPGPVEGTGEQGCTECCPLASSEHLSVRAFLLEAGTQLDQSSESWAGGGQAKGWSQGHLCNSRNGADLLGVAEAPQGC